MTDNSMTSKHTDNLIERILTTMPDADTDRICQIAPALTRIERGRLENKVEHIRNKLKRKT